MCKRGDIYYAEMPDSKGSVQRGIRPFLIIQNNIGNKFSPTVIGCAITSKAKKDMPTHVNVSASAGLDMDSKILCEQILTVDKISLKEKICTLSEDIMEQVDKAISISVGVQKAKVEKPQPDEEIIKEMLDILKNRKVSGKSVMTMFVRYCDSFNVDYKSYTKELKLA